MTDHQERIDISDEIWKTDPNKHPLFGHFKWVWTRGWPWLKRIWVPGLINRVKK